MESKIEEFNLDNLSNTVKMPVALSKDYNEFSNIEEMPTSSEDDIAIIAASLGAVSAMDEGLLENFTEENTEEPISKKNGLHYGVSSVNISGKASSVRTLLGVTTPVKVALHHSGFMYVTNEIGIQSENTLLTAMQKAFQGIAVKTAGFSFNSDAVTYDEPIISFIDGLIRNSGWCALTDIPKGKTMWDYVSIFDLPTIYLGTVKGINPNEFKAVVTCKNVIKTETITPLTGIELKEDDDAPTDVDENPIETDEDNGVSTEAKEVFDTEDIDEEEEVQEEKKGIVCNHTVIASLSPDSLLRVDPNKVNIDDVSRGKVTVEDLKMYRENRSVSKREVTLSFIGTTPDVTIIISDPSISEYLENSDSIITSIEEAVETVMEEEDTTIKRSLMIELFNRDEIMKLSHFIKSFTINGDKREDRTSIIDLSSVINSDPIAREVFLKEVKTFINEATVSIVGVAEYTCPKCKEVTKESDETYKGIIPLNMQQLFFDTFNLKFQ